MSFISDLRDKLSHVKDFAGGMKSQREHLNVIVKCCNAVFDAANNNNDDKNKVPALVNVWITQNGAPVQVRIPMEYVEANP